MPRRFRQGMLVFILIALAGFSRPASADPVRDFIVSCSYGVLAGTLVGAATLAFSDHPGDNLNMVARGASLGLYAGILLGTYVVYGAGSPGEDEDAAAQLNRVGGPLAIPPAVPHLSSGQLSRGPPRVIIAPLLGDRGLEGARAYARLVNF